MSRKSIEKQLASCIVALACALGLPAYAGHDFVYQVEPNEPTNTWIGVSGASWNDGSNWEKGVAVTNREYALINTAAGVSISATKGFEATGIIVAPEAGASSISVPTTWSSSGITLRKNNGNPSIINLSDYPFEMDVITYFSSNGKNEAAVLPNVVYKRTFKTTSNFGSSSTGVHFLSGVGKITDSWNTSTIQKDANFSGHPVEIQPLHRVLLDNKNASLTCSTLTVNGELEADGAKVTCDEIAGTGTVRLNGATITTADLDSTATIILSGANTLKYTSDVTIGKLVFADPSAKLTLSGTGTVTYSDAFANSTCLTSSGLYVPADYKASEAVDNVISVTPSFNDYVKNVAGQTSTSKDSITWTSATFWSDGKEASERKRYLIDGTLYEAGSTKSVRLDAISGSDVTFPGDVLTLQNGPSVTSPTFLALKATKTTIANLRLGEKGGVDFRPNSNTAQTLAGNVFISTGTDYGAVIRGNRGLTNEVASTISGEGILRIVPLENGPGFTAKLTADNSAFSGKIYVDWYNSGEATAALIVDNANQLGGDLAKETKDALRLNEASLVVNETMAMPENRDLRFLRTATVEVAKDKIFTVGKSNFYEDTKTTSSLVKEGEGTLVLSGTVTTGTNSKTIKLAAGTLKITGSFSGEVESGAPGMRVVKADDNTTYTLTAIVPEGGKETVEVTVNNGTEVTNAVENIITANKNPTGIYTYTNSEGTKVTNTCVAVTNELTTTTVGVMAKCTVATFLDLSQLTVRDKLYVYGSDGKYAAWQLDETAGVRSWIPMATVSGKNELEAGAPATTELAAGQAAVLVKDAASKAVQIFSGEIAANPEVSAATGASLSCLPSLTAKKVSTITTTAAAASVDGKLHIYVPGSAATDQYTSTVDDNGVQKWVKRVDTVTSSGRHLIDDAPIGDAEIPAGMGMWIQNQSGSSITIK